MRLFTLLLASGLIASSANVYADAPGYRYSNSMVKYESLDNTGLTPEAVRPGSFQFPRNRPQVPFGQGDAEVMAVEPTQGGRVPVRLPEEAGVARPAAAVRFGFPLPEGALGDSRYIRLLDADGEVVPAQVVTTGRWKDGSLKWVMLDAQAPVEASSALEWAVQWGQGAARVEAESALRVEQVDGLLMVTTGPLKAQINTERFNILEKVWVDRSGNGAFGAAAAAMQTGAEGVVLTRADGRVFRMAEVAPESVTVEELGPVRLAVRVSGRYAAEGETWMAYSVRLIFRAGSTVVEVEHTFIDDDITQEFVDVRSLEMPWVLPVPATRAQAVLPEGAALPVEAQKLSIFQRDDAESQWQIDNDVRLSGRSEGALRVAHGSGATGLAVKDFWQRWPKQLAVEGESLVVGLLPPQPSAAYGADLPYYLMFPFVEGNYRFKWGMAFTERLTIDFSGEGDLAALAAEANLPLVAILPAQWYEQTGAMGGIPAPVAEQFAVWDAFVSDSYAGHMELGDLQREYGYLNYGDWFGERKRNWGNNEYDLAHGFYQQFARTGRTDYYRLAQVAARHQADVDIVHAYPDAYYVGANHQHSIGHTGMWQGPNNPPQATWSHRYDSHTDATNGHTWIEGMLDAWRLGGDARVMEAALMLGEHVTWAVAPSFTRLTTHERSAGWSMAAALGLYRVLPDPAYLHAAGQIAAVAVREYDEGDRKGWSHSTLR